MKSKSIVWIMSIFMFSQLRSMQDIVRSTLPLTSTKSTTSQDTLSQEKSWDTIEKWARRFLFLSSCAFTAKKFWDTFIKSNATQPANNHPYINNLSTHQLSSFKDIAGKIPQDVLEITTFIKENERYSAMGAHMPKGILLVGPPGTGKTSLARAIAGETQAYFISVAASSFIEKFIGLGAARVRAMFEEASKAIKSGLYKKAIIFIDEIDAIGSRSQNEGGGSSEIRLTLIELLNQMDGFVINNSIFVMAATNKVEDIDPALKRPGRFDRITYIGLPDEESRESILSHYAKNIRTDGTIDFKALALQTAGMSGADLMNLVNEAAIRAVRENAPKTLQVHFEQALTKQQTP